MGGRNYLPPSSGSSDILRMKHSNSIIQSSMKIDKKHSLTKNRTPHHGWIGKQKLLTSENVKKRKRWIFVVPSIKKTCYLWFETHKKTCFFLAVSVTFSRYPEPGEEAEEEPSQINLGLELWGDFQRALRWFCPIMKVESPQKKSSCYNPWPIESLNHSGFWRSSFYMFDLRL